MRKIYLLTTALMALFAINANADRFLYTENYEAGPVPSTWSLPSKQGTLSIAGDEEGKYLSWALGQNNSLVLLRMCGAQGFLMWLQTASQNIM